MATPRSDGSRSFIRGPPIIRSPPVISSRPASMRSRVDLPQPEGPTRTVNSPSAMSKPMPWMIRVEPKLFSTLRNDTAAIALLSALHGAGREAADHVALEDVVDRCWRQGVDQAGRHQQLP